MSNHPYPDHVLQAVATTIAQQVLVMRKWDDLTKQTREAFLTDADDVLQALWDASRVDTWEQLEQISQFSTVLPERHMSPVTARGLLRGGRLEHDLPAYVLHWGDTDE